MNFKELFEGVEPKLPGAPKGVQIMTPQQFVAKSAGDESEEDINEGSAGFNSLQNELWQTVMHEQRIGETIDPGIIANFGAVAPKLTQYIISNAFKKARAETEETSKMISAMKKRINDEPVTPQETKVMRDQFRDLVTYGLIAAASIATFSTNPLFMALGFLGGAYKKELIDLIRNKGPEFIIALLKKQGNDVVGDLMNRFLQRNNIIEATKLAAPTRPIGDPELTDYLDRIRNQQKKKTDKYKLPYIHRSSVIGYYNEEGKKYNVDAIKQALAQRPEKLLKKNEKMKHSDGEQEQFFNVGFAALVGIALDENTNELIVVNTCPGAGSCKIDCFAMKGGKVQFQGPWLSDGRILTYLLNDPDGFFERLKAEIEKEVRLGQPKKDKKTGQEIPGYKVSIRWHDAGDFFSPEYTAMAFKLAEELPNVDFYAYTKVAGVALGQKPENFMINWSEGASNSQEKQVKAQDPKLDSTKNSRIVPSNLFYDLLVKDEKKNLVKGPEGQWQVIPDKLPELKRRLAQEYGLSPNSILSYTEWANRTKDGEKETPLKYNVIIAPGEPDLTAKSASVLSTLLLKH